MSDMTTIQVPGKWILAGEHAVVRGFPAVALPHADYHLTLRYAPEASCEELTVWPSVLSEMLSQLLGQLEMKCGVTSRDARGSLFLDSSIPLQAGFGSSAALCTAITRWFLSRHALDPERVTSLATELENYFHGKSSGLDVAAVAHNSPILFVRGQGAQKLNVTKLPRFTFHDTGLRSSTRECICKVESFFQTNARQAQSYDETMGASAERAARALERYAQVPAAIHDLAAAINEAQACFRAWDLVPAEAQALEDEQRAKGALAVKLTGAGNGGFLVALWPDAC